MGEKECCVRVGAQTEVRAGAAEKMIAPKKAVGAHRVAGGVYRASIRLD